jgi:hypothetical protein
MTWAPAAANLSAAARPWPPPVPVISAIFPDKSVTIDPFLSWRVIHYSRRESRGKFPGDIVNAIALTSFLHGRALNPSHFG